MLAVSHANAVACQLRRLYSNLPRLPFANIYNGAICLLLLFIITGSSSSISIRPIRIFEKHRPMDLIILVGLLIGVLPELEQKNKNM